METKKGKKPSKSKAIGHSVRVCSETFKMLTDFKNHVNKTKSTKGVIHMEPILRLAASLLTQDHAKILHKSFLKYIDREDYFRQKFFEIHSTNSEEEFKAFTQSEHYFPFIKEHEQFFN